MPTQYEHMGTKVGRQGSMPTRNKYMETWIEIKNKKQNKKRKHYSNLKKYINQIKVNFLFKKLNIYKVSIKMLLSPI